MFRKKILLGITSLLAIMGTGTICLLNSNETDVKTVFAEQEVVNNDTETPCLTLTVNKIQKSDGAVVSKIFEQNIISQDDANEAIRAAKKMITEKRAYGSTYTSETTCKLLKNCNLDLSDFDKGRVIINLDGHTFTITHENSWNFYEGLTIEGVGGTITTSKQPTSVFELLGYSTNLIVKDTKFKNFDCRGCPIFQIKGNEKKNIIPNITFENCEFDNCSSSRYGGVIYAFSAKDLKFNNCKFNNCSSKYGGAIYVENECGYESLFENCTISNCTAKYGGFIYYDFAIDLLERHKVTTFKNCNVINCSATNGGFAYVDNEGQDLVFENTTIEGSTAVEKGGAIYLSQCSSNIKNLVATNCSAQNGGAVYIFKKDCGVYSSIFNNCSASDKGNAIYCNSNKYTSSDNQFINCNKSTSGGDSPAEVTEIIIETKEAPFQTPVWIMGSIALAAIVGSTVAICFLFKKKRKAN